MPFPPALTPVAASNRWTAWTRVDSPLGPILLAASREGLGGLWFDGQAHHPGTISSPEDPDHPTLRQARSELADYWSHPRGTTFEVALDPQGTAFQRQVWQHLCTIEPGSTREYGDLARMLGQPGAARAVGAAVARNPLSIIIPCHRVLGQGGRLTGYAGGLDRKRALLQGEAAA